MDFSLIKCFFMKVLSVFRYEFFFHKIVMHYSLCYTDCYLLYYSTCFFMKVLSVFRYGFFFHKIVMLFHESPLRVSIWIFLSWNCDTLFSVLYWLLLIVLYCAIGWGVSFCESISLCSIAFKSNFHSVLTVLKVTQAHESSLRVSIWIFLSCYIRHSFTIPRATVRIILKWPC